MQSAEEIKNAVDNVRYYSSKIGELARKQFEIDASRDRIETQPGTIRFESLAAIYGTTKYLDLYCDNIEANLKVAEAQDKILTPDGDRR